MVSVVVKPTVRCNATCIYCNSHHGARSDQDTMTDDVLDRFFRCVDEFLADRPSERLTVLWHGGEPLLMGPEFFEKALDRQQRRCADTQGRITHRMQSNLTLFSSRFADVFRGLGIFGIGTSYETLDGLRGLGRERNSTAYRESFLRGIRVLEEERLGWGLIYVVTRGALDRPRETYGELVELKPDGNINFHAVTTPPEDPHGLAVTPRQFADFLGAVFELWWPERERRPHVEPFRVLTLAAGDGTPRLSCKEAGNCAATHAGLEPDGTWSQCGRASDRRLLGYGTVFDRSLSDVLGDSARLEIGQRQALLMEGECKGCRFWPLCHGGCPIDSWDATGSFGHKTPWCETKRVFMEEYFEPITGYRYGGGGDGDPHQTRR